MSPRVRRLPAHRQSLESRESADTSPPPTASTARRPARPRLPVLQPATRAATRQGLRRCRARRWLVRPSHPRTSASTAGPPQNIDVTTAVADKIPIWRPRLPGTAARCSTTCIASTNIAGSSATHPMQKPARDDGRGAASPLFALRAAAGRTPRAPGPAAPTPARARRQTPACALLGRARRGTPRARSTRLKTSDVNSRVRSIARRS